MSGRRVGVTGASGFIGRHLVRRLAADGDTVVAFQRNTQPPPSAPGVVVRPFTLPDRFDENDVADLDVIVHGALVEHGPDAPDSDRINREGAERLIAAARRHRTRIVFLSTMSAHPDALSHYGRNKLAIEALFDPERDTVLKLGLVLGHGGLFGSIVGLLRGARVVPLPGGGNQPIQVLAMGDLEDAIRRVIDDRLTGTYPVADPTVRTMRELYTAICHGLGAHPRFVPIPLAVVEVGAAALEALRVPFPIRRENVLGLRALRAWDNAAAMKRLGIDHPVGLEEAVARLFAETRDRS